MSSLDVHLQTPGGIYYNLLEGYPKGSFEEEKGEIVEKYLIDAADLAAFVRESFSDFLVWPAATWTYNHARAYPGKWTPMYDHGVNDYATGICPLVTRRIDWEPFIPGKPVDPFEVDSSESDEFRVAAYSPTIAVTITYGPGKCDDENDDALEITSNSTAEFLLWSARGSISWQDDDAAKLPVTDINLPVTKVQPGVEWSVKYRRIPWLLLDSLMTTLSGALGKVNSTPIKILRNAPAETILFVGFSYTTVYSWRDTKPFIELEVKLLQKNIKNVVTAFGGLVSDTYYYGHNHFLNPKANGKWQKLVDTDGKFVYELEDLGELLFKASANFPET